MKNPYLTTSFTESGNKAKNRFHNILYNKKRNLAIPVIFILSIIMSEVLISCSGDDLGIIGGADGPTAITIASINKSEKTPDNASYFACIAKEKTSLYYDRYLTNKAYDIRENTLLAVITDKNGVCYVQSADLSPDCPEGYISKDYLEFNVPKTINPFHTHDISEFSVYPYLADYVEKEFIKSNIEYYDNNRLKSINIMSKTYNSETDRHDISFSYTVEYSNYYKDPDTVDYIAKAKEEGSKNYAKLYEEYNAIQTGSSGDRRLIFQIKNGAIDETTLEIYASDAPVGTPEWKRIYKFRTLTPDNE